MKQHLKIVIWLCTIFLLSPYSVTAQTIETTEIDDRALRFSIDDPPDLPILSDSEESRFMTAPYYEVFWILGDGNFITKRAKGKAVGSNLIEDYDYGNAGSDYHLVAGLIARKSDEDPPEAVGIPDNTPPDGGVGIKRFPHTSAHTDYIPILSTDVPPSPMIPSGTNARIALGLSHFDHEVGYYIEDKSVLIFPIAYQLEGDGIILFFYGVPDGNDLRYYDNDNLKFLDPTTRDRRPVGTLLPNYWDATDISTLLVQMEEIEEVKTSTLAATYSGIEPRILQLAVLHNAALKEAQVLQNGPVYSGTPPSELRLFHFLKTSTLNPGQEYSFVAALYEKGQPDPGDIARWEEDAEALESLVGLERELIFNPHSENEEYYHFVDADVITPKNGEPDDPNELIIEEICRIDDSYFVDFKLTFQNDPEAGGDASGAEVFIQNIPNITEDGVEWTNYFTNFKCLECGLESDEHCKGRSLWSAKMPGEGNGTTDARYKLKFPGGLAPGWKGWIRFRAEISESSANLLLEKPLLRFCVEFEPMFNGQPVCGSNKVLERDICTYNDLERGFNFQTSREEFERLDSLRSDIFSDYFSCKPNPIWEGKDDECPFERYRVPRFLYVLLIIIIGGLIARRAFKKRSA